MKRDDGSVLVVGTVAALVAASAWSSQRGSAWFWSKPKVPEPVRVSQAEILDVLPTARKLYGKYLVRDLESGIELEVDTVVPNVRYGRIFPAGTILSYQYQGFDEDGNPKNVMPVRVNAQGADR